MLFILVSSLFHSIVNICFMIALVTFINITTLYKRGLKARHFSRCVRYLAVRASP